MVSKVVGELACQQNSYLYQLETKVVSCVEVLPSRADGKRARKNKEKDPKPQETKANGDDKLWEVECEDSVLFPEGKRIVPQLYSNWYPPFLGGGQPTDHGTLVTPDGPNNPIPINTVHRHGLRAVIFSPRPLAPGTTVTQHVDARRRMDHMQQHTGQHLLSAVMDNYPGLETLGWSMGASIGENSTLEEKTPNMNYVELGRKPTDVEITEIQDKCNQIVVENRSITVSTPQGAKQDSLPSDYDREKGIVRVVTIDGIDENP
jgi:misacylated tRNA(Ala) deacylase